MRKIFTTLFISFIFLTTQAQIASIFSDEFPDSAKTRVGIIGEYELNSNALTNAFVTKFYTGGYIDAGLKNTVLDRIKSKNRIGANINYGAFVAFKPDSMFHKKYISLFLSLRDRAHFDARFSRDLYKVGFYGNAPYAGKTADFNDFNLTLLRYQQVEIGIFSSKPDSSAHWGIGVSFLKGEQYASIYAKTAELYTSEDGQYINFNTSLQVAQSDTSRKGLNAFNGYGASADFYFEAPLRTGKRISKLRASLSDIGLIRFNDKSLYLNQDSLFHYSGFKVNSIYQLRDSTFSNASQSGIIKKVAPFKKQAFSVTLPAILNLNFETAFGRHFHLTEGIRYVFNANYHLLYYVKSSFYLHKNCMLSATIGYGGYGNFNYGIGIFGNFGKGFIVYAGSNNIEGFIAPKKTAGQGAYVSLIKNFK